MSTIPAEPDTPPQASRQAAIATPAPQIVVRVDGPRDWPQAMRRKTAAAYCDLSIHSFDKEVAAGRLPMPVKLGGMDHWHRQALDGALRYVFGDRNPNDTDIEPDYMRKLRARYSKPQEEVEPRDKRRR